MRAPRIRTIIILIVILVGLGVVTASGLLVWKIVKQKDAASEVTLPSIPEATLDAIRSREQTVQDINFDQEQTGVRRNPFTPFTGSPSETPATDATTSASVSTETGDEPLPEAPKTIASPSSGTGTLDPTAAY